MFTERQVDGTAQTEVETTTSVLSFLDSGQLPVVDLARIGLREGQASLPIYRVHRWFARRLGSQFRALLTAASLPATAKPAAFWRAFEGDLRLDGLTVLDPFVGGGTSLVEAQRTGASVVGYEIDPVATAISTFELRAATLSPDLQAWERLNGELAGFFRPYHVTIVDRRIHDVLYHFWVEQHECIACGTTFDLHPNHVLAVDDKKRRQWAHCGACDEVHELPTARKNLTCDCGAVTRLDTGSYARGDCTCPACGHSSPHAAVGRSAPTYRLFAQEYLVGEGKRRRRAFKAVRADDLARLDAARALLQRFEEEFGVLGPTRPIPTAGRSGGRPHVHGVTAYRQLFNDRQLVHLGVLAKRVDAEVDPRLVEVLRLAYTEHLTTNCMYTSYAAGYRRTSAMFSMHGFRHIVRPVEVNPWVDGEGRGSFPNVVRKELRALDYAKAPWFYVRSGMSTPKRHTTAATAAAVVHNKSAQNMSDVASASVDLVLTDPPYFDNVSYSELSDFYLAWMQSLGCAPAEYSDGERCAPMMESLAVAVADEPSKLQYLQRLTEVLTECKRVLKPGGRLVFTYHHTSADAWLLLAQALSISGFDCIRTFPLRGEGQGGLHSFDGTIRWDAVMVARPSSSSVHPLGLSLKQERRARQLAKGWWAKLSATRDVGYRLPDARNLLRALLCAQASPCCDNEDSGTPRVPLKKSLQAAGEWTPNGKAQ